VEKGTTTSFLLGSTFVLLMGGCHTTNPTSPAPTPPPVNVSAVTLAAAVVDAGSGSLVTASGLTMNIYAQNTTTLVAGPLTSTGGSFVYVPSSTTTFPVTYRLVVTASGYDTLSQFVTIPASAVKTDGTGVVTAILPLVQVATPPATVTTATTAVTTQASGASTTAVTTATPATTGVTGTAAVTIPASTKATTSTGTVLTGNLNLAVTYDNNTTAASLNSYPAPFQVYETANGEASSTPLPLIVGGGATATLSDASGNQASTFSTPVSITIDVPAGTPNPTTNTAVKAGDSIPIWFFGSNGVLSLLTLNSTGAIVTGKLGALVTPAAPATPYFPVTFQTDHFCFFELAWPMTTGQAATSVITITGAGSNTITGSLSAQGWSVPILVTGATSTLNLVGGLSTQTADLELQLAGNTVYSNKAFVPGSSPTIDVSSAVANLSPQSVTVSATATCQGTTTSETLPSSFVSITKVTGSGSTATRSFVTSGTTGINGTITLSGLVTGGNYEIAVTPPGLGTVTLVYTPSTSNTSTTANWTVNCSTGTTGLTGTGS